MKSFAAFAVMLFSTLVVSAQITPAMVNRPDSPLWIMSINSNLDDMLHAVTTKNRSDKKITSFQLGLIMSVPAACGYKEAFSPENLMQPDKAIVEPGGTTTTLSYRFAPSVIASFQSDNLSKNVHTQITVVHVTFSDGSSWDTPPHQQIYDKDLMAKTGELQCSVSSKAILARASAAAKCTAVIRTDMMDDGTQTFTCSTGSNQVCAVAADGQSCTATFCTAGCPSQTCQAIIVTNNPVPPLE